MYLAHDLFMCNVDKVIALMEEILYVAEEYEIAKKRKPEGATLLPINVNVGNKNKTIVYICFSPAVSPRTACKLCNKFRYISRRKSKLESVYAGCDGYRIIRVKTYGRFSF